MVALIPIAREPLLLSPVVLRHLGGDVSHGVVVGFEGRCSEIAILAFQSGPFIDKVFKIKGFARDVGKVDIAMVGTMEGAFIDERFRLSQQKSGVGAAPPTNGTAGLKA